MALPRKFTERIYEIKAHNANVTCLDVGETGRVLVTGSQDRTVNLWAIGQLDCFMSLTGHNRPVDCVRFAYNDDFVYSADDIGIIRRWDLNAQTICSTLNGHMKSVRALDFNPSGEYVVSGSHDSTVRLWDVRNHNNCMKIYRGHISNVNSVKFSPDGLWIASAGSEGCVIIWDIRKSKQIMEFCEQPPCAAITCIQFHPFEFLLAIGRADGVVCMYDLENKTLITTTTSSSLFYGKPIKCLTFSDNGECLFVGTSAYVSVIGWEPDREFDHIESAWNTLGDMKIIKRRLFCGSYEKEFVAIDAASVNRIFPFYNPSNAPNAFLHNTTVRKSFTRVSQKLRLSVGSPKQTHLIEENENNRTPSLDGLSSPNLSLQIVNDPLSLNQEDLNPLSSLNTFHAHNGNDNGTLSRYFTDLDSNFDSINTNGSYSKKSNSPQFTFSSLSNSMVYNQFLKNSISNLNVNDGPGSLILPNELSPEFCECEQFDENFMQNSRVSSNDSFAIEITNYDQNELAEDFPVNSNLNTPSINCMNNNMKANHNVNVANPSIKPVKSKTTIAQINKGSSSQITNKTNKSSEGSFQKRNKLSKIASVSTTELHKLENNMLITKSASTHMVLVNKNKAHGNKENGRNKNHITVQSINKPPIRSRTSLELRPLPKHSAERETHTPMDINYRANPIHCTEYMNDQPKSFQNDREYMNNSLQFEQLFNAHEQIFQELSNRYATLQILRNSTRSQDIINAVKQAIKSGRAVFIDLLGAILEKASLWNLDLCTLILPEIYELLQSQNKFYYSRACDTLRIILSNFLPIIQDNLDPWVNGLGVDITREERHHKCLECQRWLLRIRHLPDSSHSSNTLSQLQKMIVDI